MNQPTRRHGLVTRAIACLFVPLAVAAQDRGAPRQLPTYTRTLLLNTTPDTSANVSIGDINGDGKLDVLLVNGRHWAGRSLVMLGDGRGHFPTVYPLTATRYRSYSGQLVDLDGDAHLDVVLSNDAPDPKAVLHNDGGGHFSDGGQFGRPEWPTRNVAVADLNGDGLPDLIVANRSNHAISYVCLNQGQGRYPADCAGFTHLSATTITPADLNRDGLIDLVVPARDGGQSVVYLGDGKGAFDAAKTVPFGPPDATIRMAQVADFDGDGRPDIAVIDDEHSRVAVYFAQRDGSFAAPLPLDNRGATPYALAVADLNQDGATDIVVGNVQAPATAFVNDGSGRRYSAVSFGDSSGAVYGFAIADLDGDGILDIAAARSEAPSVVYFGGMVRSGGAPPAVGAPHPVAELDHIYIVVPPGGAAAVHALRNSGLVMDTSVTRHEGQGTASMAAFFDNAYLELLWVDSSVAVDSAHQRDLADFVRAAAWRQSGASPFGVGLHLLSGTPADLGVPIRLDSAAHLRPGSAYALLRQPAESLAVDLFIVPDDVAVTAWLGRYATRRPALFQHPLGVRRLTHAVVHGPAPQIPRAAELHPRLVGFAQANSPYLELEFDNGHRGQVLDLRPVLPLIMRY